MKKTRRLLLFVIPAVAFSAWWFKDVRYSRVASPGHSETAIGGGTFGVSYVTSSNPWYSPSGSFRYEKVRGHFVIYRVLAADSHRLPIVEFHPQAVLGDSP
jgi:hypothetical protein